MRILFLAETISPHASRWCTEFERLGWETMLASCDYGDDFKGKKLSTRASGGPLRYLSIVEQIRRLVAEFQPHLVNAHFLPSYGFAAAIAKVHPLVLTLWGSDILISSRKGFLARKRSRFVLKRSDLIVTDSDYLLGEARKLASIERSLVVSFGVRKAWYDSGKERELKDNSAVRILSTRRLESLYDVETLLNAARLLADDDVDFHLDIVGNGSRATDLRSLCKQLSLESHVTFRGHLPPEQLFSTYRNADIYVSTAKSDSTSVSLLEAMSQKLYPVVTDIPGNREWLEGEEHFFPVSDASGLAAGIRRGLDVGSRQRAYDLYEPMLATRGIREVQMKVAHLAFLKLVEEYERR